MLDREAAHAERWLAGFAEALEGNDAEAAAASFHEDGAWRDLLAFTWNIETMEGRRAVAAMLAARLAATGPTRFRLTRHARRDDGLVEAWFSFETEVARCEGLARLTHEGRADTVMTMTAELKGHEERTGRLRPLGTRYGARRDRVSWAEERARERDALGRTREPFVAIIGGGQGGLMLAARLKTLGVPALILEKNPRIGDSWRNRYRSLVLHDPVWFDHLPYLPFPPTWPVFTPKDKMGDWLAYYAGALELDAWTGARCVSAERDEAAGRWRLAVERDGALRTVTAPHLVFATGAYGPPRVPQIPGAEDFAGTFIHSSAYKEGGDWAGRRAVVIGTGSSGHDIALDLWEAGAQVTMVQRSPSIVVRSETLLDIHFANYSEDALSRGITTEIADTMAAATPYARLADVHRATTRRVRERDAEFYAALERAGFAVDFGEDETGHAMRGLRTGSGFYFDVGASGLVIDGQIAVRRGSVARLVRDGLVLEDETHVPADLVVACTGYHFMHETVAEIVDRQTADAVGPCWGLGSGVPGDPGPWRRELRNMWKPTTVEGLWFMGGNLAMSRFYSKVLALQLTARMAGIQAPVYRVD